MVAIGGIKLITNQLEEVKVRLLLMTFVNLTSHSQ